MGVSFLKLIDAAVQVSQVCFYASESANVLSLLKMEAGGGVFYQRFINIVIVLLGARQAREEEAKLAVETAFQ